MAVINRDLLEGRDDFLGFTFNNRHSSEMKIVRVSNSNRYEVNLVSQLKHTQADIPGSDGEVITSTKRQKKGFPTIHIAYDDLREEDMRALKEWLSPKQAAPLVFDELPYLTYFATISAVPQLKFICFDDKNDPSIRVYKGEGTIQFEAAAPYAICKQKYLDYYENKLLDDNDPNSPPMYPTVKQWGPSSGLKATSQGYDTFVNGEAAVYNAGSEECPVQIIFPHTSGLVTFVRASDGATFFLDMSKIKIASNNYMIDSEVKLLKGGTWDSTNGTFTPNGKIYNFTLVAGEFFNLVKGEDKITCTGVVPNSISYDLIYY